MKILQVVDLTDQMGNITDREEHFDRTKIIESKYMAKKYELWLDESGNFEDKEAKRIKENPSLIGGILVEKEVVDNIKFDEIISQKHNHATEMGYEEKKKYLLETLEKVKEDYRVKLFYIENPNYEYEKSNRQFYLRMMAEGLLQLMQVLNAENESVELDVIIAQRQDVTAKSNQRRINEKEYIYLIQKYIENKKKQNKILLHKKSRLSFYLDSAYRNPKLWLADYASHVRYRMNSKLFHDSKTRLKLLFSDAYLFTINEVTTTSYINKLLSNNMVADAIYEAFTTTEKIDLNKELKKICDRMQLTSYRLVKSQLKQFAADIVSYTANEDDYEVSERLLKRINTEFIPMLKEKGFPCENCQFHILIQLIDMFLREGDIIAARQMLEECKKVQRTFGNSLENVLSYYQVLEKEAILLIDEFRYEDADNLMGKACDSYQNIMKAIVTDSNLKDRFPDIKSEYFGDALCMKIYAEMFLQRKYPEKYAQLCEESDLALKQYPDSEGELERHRQYRSHIELEAGNYEEALQWLMKAKMYKNLSTEVVGIRDFLYSVDTTEYMMGCQYYLMYYVLIMAEASRTGDLIADTMYEVVCEYKEFLKKSGIILGNKKKEKFEEIDIRKAILLASGISYHPLEIIHWKWASYYYYQKKYMKALPYYESAYKICFKYSNYDTMKITGLGVLAEMICCLLEMGKTDLATGQYEILVKRTKELINKELPDETKILLNEMLGLENKALLNGTFDKEKLYQLSRMITY